MVILPLNKKLKKKIHRTIALAQDVLVISVYDLFPKAVIHGGTAIWRCFGSNRFSEDVDLYLPIGLKKAGVGRFLDDLKRRGFTIEKFKTTENAIFSRFSYVDAAVRCEAVFKNVESFVTKPFEMVDGTFMMVNTLSAEKVIEEKVSAYLRRRKVRDLYDIFFLLKFVEEKEETRDVLAKLLKDFKAPEDSDELKTLIVLGAVPNVKDMVGEIERWVR